MQSIRSHMTGEVIHRGCVHTRSHEPLKALKAAKEQRRSVEIPMPALGHVVLLHTSKIKPYK